MDPPEIEPTVDLIKGKCFWPFKWYFRPESTPVVQVGDVGEEFPFEKLSELLQEIDDRHWGVVRQLLIEAKIKGESMLRSDQVISNPGMLAYWSGCVNYADYVLANFEGLRSGLMETGSDLNVRTDPR
jgi:hypothetical protein